MAAYRMALTSRWRSISMTVAALAIFSLISTDRRPDDTSIQVALAAGALGLFASTDILVSQAWRQPSLVRASWLLPGLVAGFLVLCTLSAFWAVEPPRTLEVMAFAWALFVAWLALRFWTDRHPISEVKALLRWVCLSVFALSALIAFEVASNQYIHHYLVNSLGMSMSIPNYYTSVDGYTYVRAQFLSQHMGTLSYLFWPILLAIKLTFGRGNVLYMSLFVFLTVYSVFYSINETSMLSLFLGTLAFISALLSPRITTALTAMIFSLATFASVPLVYLAHDTLQLHLNSGIPPSGQARIPIWFAVATFVDERLYFGHGVVHLRALLNSGQGFIGEHAHGHNMFLQTWYEVGMLGSLFIISLGLVFLRQLYGLSSKMICFGIAGFVTVTMSLATTAWELWVPWHLGLLAFVAMIVTLLNRISLETDHS
jgi:hypothetical protein